MSKTINFGEREFSGIILSEGRGILPFQTGIPGGPAFYSTADFGHLLDF